MKVLVDLLEQTDLGKVLTKSVSPEIKSDMVDAYIRDFAQMVFKSSSSSEAELKVDNCFCAREFLLLFSKMDVNTLTTRMY